MPVLRTFSSNETISKCMPCLVQGRVKGLEEADRNGEWKPGSVKEIQRGLTGSFFRKASVSFIAASC